MSRDRQAGANNTQGGCFHIEVQAPHDINVVYSILSGVVHILVA